MMRSEIRRHIRAAVAELYPGAQDIVMEVTVPEQHEHGDYASSIALPLSRALKKNPMRVAEELAGKLSANAPFRAETAKPGFLNFFIVNQKLFALLKHIIDDPEKFGKSTVGNGKTVMVEYFQLNIAKRPHIGHIRSAIIGDALKRMFLSQGYHAVSDTHVGDWGTQFGMLLAYMHNELVALPDGWNLERELASGDPFEKLEQFYLEANTSIKNVPEAREKAKEEFAKLERGDHENRKLWQLMVDVSMRNLTRNVERLGLLPFDEHRGESFYEDKMQPIVELALQKSIAKKMEDGAVIVDLTKEYLDEAVLIKSDGASTYLLRDLATIQYRKKRWNFWRNLYVVDVRQSHHFKQVFGVAELLGFDGVGESKHIEYGFMKLPEGGAISTRGGTGISLEKVIDEAEKRAAAVIAQKNPQLAGAKEVARMVGLGALKYFDLSHHLRSDITFEWDRALLFEGNTGPYLQYTHARLKSILKKAESEKIEIPEISLDALEHRLTAAILRLPEAVEDALKEYTPNTLANYLFSLAQLANEFYHSHPVMQETDERKKTFRLALVAAAALTLKNGLGLLGIDTPEEM